jgi:hypothetical protein
MDIEDIHVFLAKDSFNGLNVPSAHYISSVKDFPGAFVSYE